MPEHAEPHERTAEKSIRLWRSGAVRQIDALVFYVRGDRGQRIVIRDTEGWCCVECPSCRRSRPCSHIRACMLHIGETGNGAQQ